MKYKVIVIGGGPGGYVAAIRAAQLGASVALIEKGNVGGTCLNRGCIPTKTLAAGVSVLRSVRRAAEFGIEVGDVSVDFGRLMERKKLVVDRLIQGVEFLLNKNKIDLFKGLARLSGCNAVVVEGDEAIKVLEAENIILATGTEPALIDSFGYDGTRVITSDEVLNLKDIPQRMLIIGGGVIGCEFACIFAALGSKVTVVEVMPTILPLLDKEVSRKMEGLLKRQGININTKVRVQKVKKNDHSATVLLENGEELEVDKVLISIGRIMNIKGIGLEEAGVALGERGQVIVNDRMETSVAGIYAIGDITGKVQLAHVASAQGLVAATNIMNHERRDLDYRVVPSCIFTHPEVASVGLTSQEAADKGIKVISVKVPFIASGKAQAMGETEGFVKILADAENDNILGVHIIGPHATDLIAEAALAMQARITVKQLADTIHAHPTLAESLMEAAEAVQVIKLHR